MTTARPHYLPLPYQDSAELGRLILRDGSTAIVRLANPADQKAMELFFASLSERSRQHRFFSLGAPSHKFIESLCNDSDPRKQLSLVVIRAAGNASAIIATANYIAHDSTTAEVALAVSDKFQGKGVGTLLLERLSVLAARNGFSRFWAITMAENKPMLDVFRESGFECRSRSDGTNVEIDLSVLASQASVARAEFRDRVATVASLRPFFLPRNVAVVGASSNPQNIGTRILRAMLSAGFKGAIYPVNPNATSIEKLQTYRSVRELPDAADLAIIAVPANAVGEVIDDCAARGVRAIIVITAGFAEVGDGGRQRQQELLDKIRGHGMRMVGPNCLGLLNTDPAVRLNASFAPDFPAAGSIAFCSQSGALGLAVIALARAHARPVKLHQRGQ